jgi:biopolymer transport protein ExbD
MQSISFLLCLLQLNFQAGGFSLMKSAALCILYKKINMAQMQESRGKSTHRSSARSLRVDLTPMVDLGFLLITFFILTTALSTPTVARLVMPKDSPVKTFLKESTVLTLMLMRNDSIGYYEGMQHNTRFIHYCSFGSLRSVIQKKQQRLYKIAGNPGEMVIIIMPGKESTYNNFVQALDEIEINDVKHYFVSDPG